MSQLGDTLRHRRTELGRSVADAESATKIRARLIEALENGNYDQLPNPAYVRGYITSYARWLELDPAPLLTMYRAESGAVGPTSALPKRETVVVSREKAHAIPWKLAVTVALVLVAIVAIVWGFGRLGRSQSDETLPIPSQPEATSTPGGTGTTQTTEPATVPTPTTEPQQTAQPFTLAVLIDTDGASWVRITVDGEKAYEGTLVGGQSKEFEVTEKAVVLVGRPSAVTITRDGQEVEIPPSDGTPEVTLTAEVEQ